MLSLAPWALPSLQLHQAFPGTALAADTSEDHFSIRRQWTLCLVPTRSALNGPFSRSHLCNKQRLPSLSTQLTRLFLF